MPRDNAVAEDSVSVLFFVSSCRLSTTAFSIRDFQRSSLPPSCFIACSIRIDCVSGVYVPLIFSVNLMLDGKGKR